MWNLSAAGCLLVLLTSQGLTQQRGVPRSCVPDSAVQVKLVGFLGERTFPGPPNHERLANGDTTDTALFLQPDGWACQPARGDTVPVFTIEAFKWIQLFLDATDYAVLRRHLGQHIIIHGTLFPAETLHSHTVLMLEPSHPLTIDVQEP